MRGRTGRFRRADRLRDSRDFRRVLREGRRRAGRELVVFAAPRVGEVAVTSQQHSASPAADGPRSRLGLTASRKVGNAVIRNRFKRRVRTWFRVNRWDFPMDVDLVVIARPSAANLSFKELEHRLSDLVEFLHSSHQPIGLK